MKRVDLLFSAQVHYQASGEFVNLPTPTRDDTHLFD